MVLNNAIFGVHRNGQCNKQIFYKGIIGMEYDHFMVIFLIVCLKTFMVKKIGCHNMTVLYPKPYFNVVCYKATALYDA